VDREDVLVIGAGPAGLATSAGLRRADVAHVVVERASSVAASWKQHYDRLHLHTVKEHSQLPYTSWPAGTIRYPSRDDVVRYLEGYAAAHGIAPRFGVEVQRVARASDRFLVETNAGRLHPRVVVVATGHNGIANWPDLRGLGEFRGSVVHTQSYKNAQPYSSKRTLVVGCGNSGAEIALDLAECGVEVAMVVRAPVHVVPRDLWGRRSAQETSLLLSGLPIRIRDAIAGPILRVAVGDLSPWGIVRPSIGPARLVHDTGRIPILDIGTIAQIKAGRIKVVPGVEEVCADRVRFADGRVEPFDAIILATGYKPALERFLDDFTAIADERGSPRRSGREAEIPGLFFVGFRSTQTGLLREISLEAPRVATAIRAKLR
jgi:thioredoxin reductase